MNTKKYIALGIACAVVPAGATTLSRIDVNGTRRKLGGKAMEYTIVCGWILILLLFAFTMWNDIARVFGLN